ncbi:MAG: tetratricopeptide repeat protein [bacterium]|nr:tetratricopeptide repeat protein [bacterium]
MLEILRRVAGRRHARLNERVRAGDALEEDGRWSEARSVYTKALAREPENVSALRRLAGLAQLEGQAEEALELWQRLNDLRPERPDACLQLARLHLHAGHAREALRFAERAAALAPEGKPHEIAHRARNLRDHLVRGIRPLAARHVAIGGMSFCGSTLLGFLLGSLPAVTNVGESHNLVYSRHGMRSGPAGGSGSDLGGMAPCSSCGAQPCPLWTLAFRHALAEEPVDWYGKLATQAGTPVLLSSDKSHAKLSGLDPFGRHDLIVLFKSPSAAWASARRRPRPPKEPSRYMTRWEREYARLLHDLPVEGRRVVLHFDAFRRDPAAHLRRLAELLEIPIPVGHDLLAITPDQHVVGGNKYTHAGLRAEGGELAISAQDRHTLPADEAEAIAARELRSPVLRELREGHAAGFDGC